MHLYIHQHTNPMKNGEQKPKIESRTLLPLKDLSIKVSRLKTIYSSICHPKNLVTKKINKHETIVQHEL